MRRDDVSEYVLLYRGGTQPQSDEEREKATDAWIGWFGRLGSSVRDPGNPFGQTKRLGADGTVSDTPASDLVGGYSIVTADGIDDALALAKDCPALDSGSTITIHEVVPVM
jgi:hypothetical protein